MTTCWSCLIILEEGAKVCRLCGADQTRPVAFIDIHAPQPRTLKSFFHDWGMAIFIITVAVGGMTGILWHSFGGYSRSPSLQAAEVTAKSLQEIREALSGYALTANDAYPATLDLLGGRTSLPTENASSAGYILSYSPQTTAGDGVLRGFVLLARPQESGYLNLYINETGVVRATEENRPATGRDPPL